MTINLFTKINKLSDLQLKLILVLIAMLIAIQIQYIQHGWINPDSVLYFESAKLFAIGRWHEGFNVFQWPAYSILIAVTHKVTTLSIHHSAQCLSVIFFGITTASFLKIIELAGGDKKALIAGALTLFSASYLVGDILAMLLRDQGFWAFFLTGLVFFIRFYRTYTYKDAIFWQISMIIATLFRIEGITYLIALPLILLINHDHKLTASLSNFIKCNCINIFAVLTIIFLVAVFKIIPIENLGRLNEVFTFQLYDQLTHNLFARSAIMNSQVLGRYLNEYGTGAILLAFVYVMLTKTIFATGAVNSVFAVMALKSNEIRLNKDAKDVLTVAAIIAIANMALIITKSFVLSSRYILALSLILMIFASFYLAYIFKLICREPQTNSKKKWLIMSLLALMLTSLVSNMLPKKDGYNYIQQTVTWLMQNNPSKQTVFYDDSRARFYANAPFIGTWGDNWAIVTSAISRDDLKQYKFLVISYSSKHPEREQILMNKTPQFSEVKRFGDPRNKKIMVIYKRKDT
jgi:hypothetical protein